jgi:hypothetical protein
MIPLRLFLKTSLNVPTSTIYKSYRSLLDFAL